MFFVFKLLILIFTLLFVFPCLRLLTTDRNWHWLFIILNKIIVVEMLALIFLNLLFVFSRLTLGRVDRNWHRLFKTWKIIVVKMLTWIFHCLLFIFNCLRCIYWDRNRLLSILYKIVVIKKLAFIIIFSPIVLFVLCLWGIQWHWNRLFLFVL